jgi:hypothetical protein
VNAHEESGERKTTQKGIAKRFLESTFTQFEDDCIIWPFTRRRSDGRAQVWDGRRVVIASRLICERFNGKPPTPQHDAAHSCGNGVGGCINGHHLRWATKSENQADRVTHGISNRGERCGTSRLTEEIVLSIYHDSRIDRIISKELGVHRATVNDIKRGKSWAWLTQSTPPK